MDDTSAIDQLAEKCARTFSSDIVLWKAQPVAS